MKPDEAQAFLDAPAEGVGGPMSKDDAASFLDEKPESGPASAALVSRMAGNLGRKAAARVSDLARQLDPDVDYSGVPDASLRSEYAFLDTPEEQQHFLEKHYGKQNVTKDSFGRSVIIKDGKKVSFLPRANRDEGKPWAALSSYGDAAGEVLPVAGMVAGAAAGSGLGSIPMAGVGATIGKSGNKLIKQYLVGENTQTAGETLTDIGIEGLKGAAAEAGGHVIAFGGRSLIRPFAPGSVFGPWTKRTTEAWRRQQEEVTLARSFGFKPKIGVVAPNAGLTQRVQNAGFRLFGDDLVFKNRPIIEGEVEKLTGSRNVAALAPADEEKLSLAISQRVEGQINVIEAQANAAIDRAERELSGVQKSITEDVGAPPPNLSRSVSDTIESEKDTFSERVSQVYGPVDALVGKPVVPTGGVTALMRTIVAEGPQTVGGKSVLASETIEKFAAKVLEMEPYATFQQMQMLRTVLANRSALEKLNAGLSEGQAKRLWLEVNKAFNDAIDTFVSYPPRDVAKKALAEPDGITGAVARLGGLRKSDLGGEFPDVTRVPAWARKGKKYAFWLQHNGPNARTLDDMREQLTQSGYLSEGEGIREMVDKIAEELRVGKPLHFAAGDAEAAAERAAIERENLGTVETVNTQAALRALRRGDRLYAAGMKRFGDLSVEALYKDATARGGVPPDKVAQFIAQPGMVDKFNRIAKVLGPDTMSQVASARWAKILETSVDPMSGEVSGRRLAKQLNDLGPILDRLYGPVEATRMRVYARQLSALDGDVSAEGLVPGKVSEAIKDAITKKELADETSKRLWMRQIRDEGPDSLKAAEFLTHPDRRLTLTEAINMFGKNSPEAIGLREYLARKIFATMEVEASRGAARYGSKELMGEPLVRELNRYGRPYLEEVFGKRWTDEAFKFARAAETATRKNPLDSGGLIAATIGLHWIRHLGEIARFLTAGELLQSEAAITYWSRGIQNEGVKFLEKIMRQGVRVGVDVGVEHGPKAIEDRARGYRTHMQNVIDRRFRSGVPIEGRQHGGPVNAGQPYVVGENGPEVVVPGSSGVVLPRNDVMGAAGHKAYLDAVGSPIVPAEPAAVERSNQGVVPIPANVEGLAKLLVQTGRAPDIITARRMAADMAARRP